MKLLLNPEPPASGGAADWAATFPDDVKPIVQAKGWKTPLDAVNSYRNLEKVLGDNIQRPKTDWDENKWNDFYKAAGRPETPDKYEFDMSKLKDRKVDENRVSKWRQNMHKFGLSDRQAKAIWNEYVTEETAADEAAQNAQRQEIEVGQLKLRDEWKGKYDENLALAKAGLQKLGPEFVEFVTQSALGNHPTFIKLMHAVGSRVGEDVAKGIGGGSQAFGITPEAAKQSINEMIGNKEEMAKFNSGDKAAIDKWRRLHASAYPSDQK